MTGRDTTAMLPPELVLRFFRGWTFEELQSALAVSTRWRAIALNHPSYWRSIRFRAQSDNAVRLSLLRIERTYGRSFSLTCFRSHGSLAQLLAAVTKHLNHIVGLIMFVDDAQHDAVFDVLRQPAPKLESLHLEFRPIAPDLEVPIVPSDLFSQHAPVLRKVRLYGVRLVEPLAVFALVSEVFVHAHLQVDFVPCAFTHFPSVKRLRFSQCTNLSQSQHAPLSFWTALDMITLSGGPPEILSSAICDLPLCAVHTVVLQPGLSHIDIVSSHLHGALDLSFVSDHQFNDVGTFVLDFRERSTRRSRQFAEHWRHLDLTIPLSTPHGLIALNIADRLVSLSISADILPGACVLLPPLPNVVEVAFLFHHWGFSGAHPAQPLIVPKLRSLKLQGHEDLPRVSRSFLWSMSLLALTSYVPPLTVVVEQAVVDNYSRDNEPIEFFLRL
ncbi:hypothetical protein EXIGLDRAFT_724515 [Exidia glandulosa HHB12029]|uniref:F-box domain-containing protein n=1 Tax=Exidia glandulosa HHB12029 TaxID=1314781 RepID=A0A165EDL1_EXIGL|nr:hypothetical protein EXIGLDRAFT_724515 [Exidia glandulosa HHB12029]